MALSALVTSDDVEVALVRPLTDLETTYIDGLCDKASELLRAALPTIDARINRDPSLPGAVGEALVAGVLADVVKRFLDNPKGLSSRSESAGPYNASETYRSGRAGTSSRSSRQADVSTGLVITAGDVSKINAIRTAGIGVVQLAPTAGMEPRIGYGPAYDWFGDPK